MLLLGRRQANTWGQTAWIQRFEEHLGHKRGLFAFLEHILRGSIYGGAPPWTKELAGAISFHCPSAETQSHTLETVRQHHWLPNLLMPSSTTPCSRRTALLSQACHSPSMMGLSPRPPGQVPAHTTSLKPGVLKVSRFVWDRAPRALHCSWRKDRQKNEGRQHGNSDLKNA